MKIGHFQCQCTAGQVEVNVDKVLEGLRRADEEHVEIVSFPESLLTGYFTDEAKARQHSLTIDGPEIASLLDRTKESSATFMVGFNEQRGNDLYNTVLIAEGGELLGTYSKAFPCFDYFTPGREFPVFERGEIRFGVVICADGGYIEPTRILMLKGADVIFAPHYNYIAKENLITHFQKVRSDHSGRAVENGVWFLRGNSVTMGQDSGMEFEGVGYGDSYLMDPRGEIVVRSQRHVECFIAAEVDLSLCDHKRTITSATELGPMALEFADKRSSRNTQ